ncbi:Cell death protease [Blyttiomyces sp. JEL0837]|nr:Cell death protease [Blyttiomyces sp. JEL0837]
MFTKDGTKLYANHHSWHKQANLLYVEQPVGTGYSFTTGPYAQNETDVARDFYTFMNNFYTVFPEAKTWDLFITGESYAGVYIPYIAQKFLDEKVLNDGSLINLKALGIGNGYLDPYRLQPLFAGANYLRDFYLARDFFGRDTAIIERWNKIAYDCTYVTFENYTNVEFGCNMWNFASSWKTNKTGIECVDPYNIDHVCTDVQARQDSLSNFLNNPEVRKSLHVDVHVDSNGNPVPWTKCSDDVGYTIDDTNFNSYTIIPDLLNRGLPIVIYNGDRDAVCNYVGEEAIIDELTWNGATGFQTPFPSEPNWILGTTQKAGYIRSERGLTYIRVKGAGHMVPTDTPAKGSLVLQTIIQAGEKEAHVAARR